MHGEDDFTSNETTKTNESIEKQDPPTTFTQTSTVVSSEQGNIGYEFIPNPSNNLNLGQHNYSNHHDLNPPYMSQANFLHHPPHQQTRPRSVPSHGSGIIPGMTRKLKELGPNETINSFETWKGILIFALNQEPSFAPFLIRNKSWERKARNNPLRGLASAQEVVNLEFLLAQIANLCPVISRHTIIKNSTSLENVWHSIRTHYGFQSSGSNFLNLVLILS